MTLRNRRLWFAVSAAALFLAGCADLIGANFDAEAYAAPGAGGAGGGAGGASTSTSASTSASTSTGGAGGTPSTSTGSAGGAPSTTGTGGGGAGGTVEPACPSTCSACADDTFLFAVTPVDSAYSAGFATGVDIDGCGRIAIAGIDMNPNAPGSAASAVVGLVEGNEPVVARLPVGPPPDGSAPWAEPRSVHLLRQGDPIGQMLVSGWFGGKLRVGDQGIGADFAPTGFVAAVSVEQDQPYATVGWATVTGSPVFGGSGTLFLDAFRSGPAAADPSIFVAGISFGPAELRRYPDLGMPTVFVEQHDHGAPRIVFAQLRGDGIPLHGHSIHGGTGAQVAHSVDADDDLVVLGGGYEGFLEGQASTGNMNWFQFVAPGPLPGGGQVYFGLVAAVARTGGSPLAPRWVRGFGRSDASAKHPNDPIPTSGFVVRTSLAPDKSIVAAVALTASEVFSGDAPECAPLSAWTPSQDLDTVVVKLDRVSGRCLWAKRLRSDGLDGPRGLAVAPDGKLFVTGTYSGVPKFDGADVAELGAPPSGTSEGFLLILDESGALLEAMRVPVSDTPDRPGFMPVASTEGLFALGFSKPGTASMFGLDAGEPGSDDNAFFLRVPRSALLP